MDRDDSNFLNDSERESQIKKPLGFDGLKKNPKSRLSLRGASGLPRVPPSNAEEVKDPQVVSRKGGHESLIVRKFKIKQRLDRES